MIASYSGLMLSSTGLATGVADVINGFKTPDGLSGEAINLIQKTGKELGLNQSLIDVVDAATMISSVRTIVKNLNSTETTKFLESIIQFEQLSDDLKETFNKMLEDTEQQDNN